ncbi:FAD-linked oxidoreductase [Pseudoclavibacter endophyticus]|uniref:FAD-binding oxidoreductase n=1 Tax=Pseudoclavibacter endophyticus TaxID=1778590 RepID=A0A6H9WCX8_9MICO|nr:FAD-binding oxidoreductase [Pseudoclavibacter endophyticus]KAB1648812.1 FAD-binding oxidoreductase [Pseudoclavibacter endophyticus]GGA68311.1 FAD-linked oxidoreductase [Pseudoclavibacter endophyticus]
MVVPTFTRPTPTIDRDAIVDRLTELLGAEQVDTDEQRLREASVDRFHKYEAAHGIFDGPIPAAIAYAASTEQVRDVLTFADRHRVNVVPRTGRTGTEGGLETAAHDTIVLDCSRMDRVIEIDEQNMMATVQCGVPLQRLDDELRARGLTTAHSPQSKPLAQFGGLVATRSIGQLSTLYGGIEDMVVGLEAVFPDGSITRIKNVPRRAAGPDIRHVVIGNEGALCVVTEVTVKLFPYEPQNRRALGYIVDRFADGIEGLRRVVQAGYRPSVCRVYSEDDAAQHFSDVAEGKPVVVVVADGPRRLADATAEGVVEVFEGIPHRALEPSYVEHWLDHLNWGPEKIDAERRDMLEHRRLGYTTEVAIDWSRTNELYECVMRRIQTEFARADDLFLLGAHSSHSYQTGTNLYFVYDYRINCEPRDELHEYHEPINAIIVDEALRLGGSMVHHHGIGKYRTPWTKQEHGSAYRILAGLKREFDPNGVMNAGTIYPVE